MDCRKWLELYSTDIKLKYPSELTRKNYYIVVSLFLQRFSNYREPKEIPTEEIKKWVLEAKTINTRKHRICGVKSFYQLTVGMPSKIDKVPYPKSEKKLPIVLSQDEIQRMFDVCENLKHKAILAVLYSCGLRVSELINLKWSHIDRSRGVINIIAGKGKKDRQVMLAPELMPILEAYYRQYKSVEYVFNGQTELQYTASSVRQVVKQLAKTAGIKKDVWTHLIRHCTFTHMVENQVDINLIQRIAGHSSPKVTSIYTHISDSIIRRVHSPFSAIRV